MNALEISKYTAVRRYAQQLIASTNLLACVLWTLYRMKPYLNFRESRCIIQVRLQIVQV